MTVNRHATGQTGEALVAAELARAGFIVALPTGNAEHIDILAYRAGENRAVQVKCVSKGSFQFSSNKFVDVALTGEIGNEFQEVLGARKGIDENIDLVIVFLGQGPGSDRFYCIKLGDFAKFAANSHAAYINKHQGQRPGKNKASMHGAFTEQQLIDSRIFCDINKAFYRH
ncbi:group I intron-associated PD-(D/E)XK endonuclease [Tabrizicola sp.]|uniref:group I intron-associated PD-(D/E)XK endonuclease n=1 Tax=Tabrizicola sp. TaxID=2005166 RepID=UPI001A372559|nr:group I intron-associated PD-(D/E)XK endonuclease [Tabrizicola sp.]MBL9073108.1 hypothetical protein [Tabrizicola sp.]